MRKSKKILLISILIISLIFGSIYFIASKNKNNQIAELNNIEKTKQEQTIKMIEEYNQKESLHKEEEKEKEEQEEVINITECSEEFMQEYFEETKQMQESNKQENILIVTSKQQIENTYGATDMAEGPNNQYFIKYDSEEQKDKALENFKNTEQIEYVEENHIYTLFDVDYNSWGIETMGLDSAIQIAEQENINNSLEDITVAIIDTGCKMDLFNQSYSGKITEIYNLYDGSPEIYDSNGHGTHIAGTIAEGTSSNVKILPIKVSDSRTMSTMSIINAINYITYYDKADVINMSFGSTDFSKSLYVAIEAASKNNIISVAASGNESTSQDSYPAAFDNTISVSAVDSELKLASFSNYGEKITFTAPGANIKSINGTMSGTSMAAPHVACAVAMLKSANIDLSLEEITTLLKNEAIDLGDSGWDRYYGYGLIDLSNFNEIIGKTENTDIINFEVDTTGLNAIYGNITNLMNCKIILKDENGNQYAKLFSDIDDLEIKNYDAFAEGSQNIIIKYNNIEKTITVNNGEYGGDTSAYYITTEVNNTTTVNAINKIKLPKKIYIPEYLYGYKVVGINKEVFKDTVIDAVILPSSVTSIGDDAFYNSTIKSVTGGADEISIGVGTFYNAYKLEVFEPKISELGAYGFCNAYSINNLTLSDNIKTIGAYTFINCVSLENINIPKNLIEIQEGALANTKIKNLNIPKSLVNIAADGFLAMFNLETIVVEKGNPLYDSRENCNALIYTSSNTIKLGSANTIISDTVTTIDEYAFYYNSKIEKINTNKVKTINDYAFEYCINLTEFYLTETVETLGYCALRDMPKATVYTYNQDKFRTLMNDHRLERVICIIPREISVSASKTYRAFEKVEDIEIDISYYGFGSGFSLGDFSLEEKITEGYKITYVNGGDCLQRGESYFTVSATTKYGIKIEEKVNIYVEKAIPDYIIPTGITALAGTKLSEIPLPEGFEWMDATQTTTGETNEKYYAKFIPKDTENYEIVENIEITINPDEIKIQKIILEPENLIFNNMEKQQITASIIPENAVNKNLIWKSTNTNIAKVNQNGEVIPVKDGTCEIICAAEIDPENIKARCKVIVDDTLQVQIMQIYNEDNTVTIKVQSKYEFKDTKPTWQLSEDRKTYTKTYNTNGTYTTRFEDIYGHTEDLTFIINEIASKYFINKTYNANTNTVTVSVTNNFEMQQTKPTWNLSADSKIYSKTYTANGTYTTNFMDSEGSETLVTFTVSEIDNVAPNLKINMTYNEEINIVTVEVTSDEMLGETKPTWTLSVDKMMYSKIYNLNGEYTTTFQDIYGNSTQLTFEVNQIQSKYVIEKLYDVTTNTVTVSVINNLGMQHTKPTWNLSADTKIYTKTYTANGTYTTKFVDIEGTEKPLTFTIEEIDDKGPNLTVEMFYANESNVVIVEVKSDEILGKTKPTWRLSADKKVYSKTYELNGTYTTTFKDIYGNETILTFEVNQIQSKYQIIKLYDSFRNKVTVEVINNFGMQATKPTWQLSADTRVYSKQYTANGTYTTTFVDTQGVVTPLTFTIDEIK